MMKNTLTLWWISSLVLAPSGAQMVGDVFENVEGYIMDRFCIERGTMLDPPLPTLVDADKHTVHCLIDVPSCLNSPFEVLIDPQGSSTNYTRGYVLDDASKAAMVDLAKRVGECDTCTGQGSLAAGFRARMTAEVVALADEATGTPPVISASNIQARQNVDCTQYQDTHVFDTSLGQGLTLNYLVNEDTFSGQVVYEGQGWVGFGISQAGDMVGSLAIIGLPDEGTVGKYSLGARTLEAVTLTDQQTLVEGTIEQNETHTVLTFVKLLEEPGEIAIDPNGENHFLVAAGSDNELAYHDKRETLPFQLSVCGTINVAEPTDPTQAPSATSETPAPAPQEEPTGPIDCTQFQSFHTYEGTGLTLSYVVLLDEESGEGNISARVEYEGQGWVGFGISESGGMVGSLAIIGLPDEPISDSNPGKYFLGGQTTSAVTLTDQQTLLDGNIEQNETHTILTFTKLLIEPNEISINPNGDNFFLAAGGSSNDLGFHNVRGTSLFNLAPCTPESGGSTQAAIDVSLNTKQESFKAHGFLMAISWGILTPLAVSSSLGRHLIPVKGLWFQIHRALNMLVLIMTIIGFAVVVNAVEKSRIEPDHFKSTEGVMNKHKTIGLVVFILVIVQAIGGIMRPHLPTECEEKSLIRMLWEIVHRFSGFLLLAMAWYQCHSGLVLYAQIFVEDETHTNIFWGIVGAIGGIALVGYLSRFIFPSAEKSSGKTPAPPSNSETAVRSGTSNNDVVHV